jgi:1-acyl-sn-glycerol-3-phosphate acyltransferase
MKIFARIKWAYATFIVILALFLMIVLFPILKSPKAQKFASKFIQIFTGFKIKIQGKEDKEADMFILNHQSDIDIAIMELSTNKELAWVAKKELFDVPFFGLALKLPEDIAVDREDKKSLIKLLKDAKDRLDKGKTITIFPEGTRSRSDKMLPFKSGAKLIADKYKLKVQPVILMKTAKHYNIKEFHYQAGTIKVIFLDSFYADRNDPDWLKELRKKMQKVYDDELANNSSNR